MPQQGKEKGYARGLVKVKPLNHHLPPSIRSHNFLFSEIPTGSDQDFTLENAFVSEGTGLTAALGAPGRNTPLCPAGQRRP